jgi:quercetin dioxygenase-like cupin family protein
VIFHDSIDHAERAPGVTVSGMVGADTGATQISSGITAFAPGCSNTTHYHNAEESVIVIEGQGILVINGEEHQVKPHDAAFITPGTHHRLINTGDQPFKIAWSYATVNVSRTLVE